MSRHILFLLVAILSISSFGGVPAIAQRGNVWALNHDFLDFNSGKAIRKFLPSGVGATLSTGCSPSGQLQVISSVAGVEDRNGNPMNPNAFLSLTSMEYSIIIPHPCDTNVYYVFDQFDNLPYGWISYVKVDMRLNGGLGDIAGSETILLNRAASDNLLATPMANGNGYWLITHDVPDPRYKNSGSTYFVYRITAAGVDPSPIISSTDIKYLPDAEIGNSISPDGTVLFAPSGSDDSSNFLGHGGKLLHFDRTTGRIVDWFAIPDLGHQSWSCFSPDSKKLYVTEHYQNADTVIQYDLSSGDSATVVNSGTPIAFQSLRFALGPDGLIYTFPDYGVSTNYIGAIQHPNLSGQLAGYKQFAIQLQEAAYSAGYPNVISNYLVGEHCGIAAQIASTDSATCGTRILNFEDRSSGNPTEWKWSFPGAVPVSSSDRNPRGITYSMAGTYSVSLIVKGADGSDTTTEQIVIVNPYTYAATISDGRIKVVPQQVVDIPARVILPGSQWGSIVPSSLTYILRFPTNVLSLDVSSILAAINPPPGWQPSAVSFGQDTLVVTLQNPLKHALVNPLDLGSVTFNVSSNSGHGLLRLSSLVINTADTSYSFCTSAEGDYLANVVVDTSAAFVMTSKISPADFVISPNPVGKGRFKVIGPTSLSAHETIAVFDLLGRQVKANAMASLPIGDGQFETSVNIPQLPVGHYFLRITAPDFVITKEFVFR